MTDAQVMKMLGDPSRSLRIMKLGHEVEYLAGQQSEKNMLALAIHRAFYEANPLPVADILKMVLDSYYHNPTPLIAMFGETLITNIKNVLHED